MSYFFDQDQTLRIAKGEDLFHFKDCNQNRPVLDLRPLWGTLSVILIS